MLRLLRGVSFAFAGALAAMPAGGQEAPWYALGEHLLIDIPEGAIFLSGQDYDGSYVEDYVLEENGQGVALTGLRIFRTREDHPFSAVSALEAAQTVLGGIEAACPALVTNDRALLRVDDRPGLSYDVTCPSDAAQGRRAEHTILTAVAGPERMHVFLLQASDESSAEALAAHAARIEGAQFCRLHSADGPCHAD